MTTNIDIVPLLKRSASEKYGEIEHLREELKYGTPDEKEAVRKEILRKLSQIDDLLNEINSAYLDMKADYDKVFVHFHTSKT